MTAFCPCRMRLGGNTWITIGCWRSDGCSFFYVTAGVAALGCFLAWKWPRTLVYSSVLALVLAAGSLSAGIFIAKAGGQIRHREFRSGPPPVVPKSDQGS